MAKQWEIVRRTWVPAWDRDPDTWFVIRSRTLLFGITLHTKVWRTMTPEGPETIKFSSLWEAKEYLNQVIKPDRRPNHFWEYIIWKE